LASFPTSTVQSPIYFDSRWNGNHGIGRFSIELQQRLHGLVPLKIMGAKLSLFDPIASAVALARCRQGCFLTPGFNAPVRSPIPFAFTLHDLIHLQVPTESSSVRRLYYATIVKPAARKARRIFTVSNFSRQQIIDWSGIPEDRVVVVGNGVSEVFSPGTPPRDPAPYMLHVGRRSSHKNIPRLLQAFAASRSSRIGRLVFTGDPDQPTLQCVRAMGISDRVSFKGNLTDAELADLYRGARALVFPSLQEGFGLPLIEAMACGIPVITSDVSSMAEIAGRENALLVDPTDVDALAAAMDRMVEDDQMWQTLSARGLERARDFTWSAVAARVQHELASMSVS
jgi:glycosyltransferase involved in cell wall biosynthesis